ncbi:hypothetical protein [Fluviicola chungangensis]|uniref:Uncharacterized protein n=1 Tax=Fluviicola chungangensis TaxID=2597671 RepID=A0A556MNI4_9FLAO|nr:hypothetical protein [Fluviicola chungangensis]TSJ41269.1 hypothetical protein FO442_15270 [Fluviicola chungangensis]
MTTTAPNSTTSTGGVKLSDPRIISPQIKVIYPSENVQKDLAVSEVQTTAPTPQVLPPVTPTQTTTVPTKESTIVTESSTPPTATQTVETPKKPKWLETIKENAGLFLAVALISVGVGIFIGKKL